jgi:ribosomal protein S18 acetylase RimI-like enzyme
LGNFHFRSYDYARDKQDIINLLLHYRLATSVAVYPTIWRVRLLLTSRVWDAGQDVRIWDSPSGQMAGFAMLWRRYATSPYLALDRFVHPSFATSELASIMLGWGSQRGEAIATRQGTTFSLYAQDFAPQLGLESLCENHGFTPLDDNPHECDVYFGHSLEGDLPAPILPPGYIIRPVRGIQEFKAYQSLYSFAAVNPEHRQELFDSDEYNHLVVVDAHGKLAAYCESSICRLEWQEGRPRVGWIDYIETQPEQQGQGLGQAVLWAGLECLRDWGAETAMLVMVNSNAAANRLYIKTGFERMPNIEPRRYVKNIA